MSVRRVCLGGTGMERRKAAGDPRAEQWIADISEDLEVLRYPTRWRLIQAVDEAARRADGLARLEYALLTRR
jgi:hypothetical protein